MKENQGKSTLVRVSETCSRRSASGVRREIRERGKVRGKRGFFRSLIFAACPRSELLEQARVSEASNYRGSTVDGTRGGGGRQPGVLGRGVPPGSPNPDFISGQKMSFSTTRFQTRPLKPISFSDLAPVVQKVDGTIRWDKSLSSG